MQKETFVLKTKYFMVTKEKIQGISAL